MASSLRVLHLIRDVCELTEAERAELADELERMRSAAARQLLDEYIAENGPISDEERAQVRREWPRD